MAITQEQPGLLRVCRAIGYAPSVRDPVFHRVTKACMPLLLMAAVSLTGGQAAAQDKDPGTRLILERDAGPARMILKEVDEPEVIYPEEGVSIGVRSRYTTVHDALLDIWLLDHTSYNGWSVGAEVGIDGPLGGRVVFGLDYTDLSMPEGNWRASKAQPVDASFTEVNLGLIAFDATFLWRWRLAEKFGFNYGVGVGLGYLIGDVFSTDVLPTCQNKEDVPNCPHWNEVTRREQAIPPDEYPTRVLPLLNLQAGIYVLPGDGWQIRMDVGYRLAVFYTGLAVRSTF